MCWLVAHSTLILNPWHHLWVFESSAVEDLWCHACSRAFSRLHSVSADSLLSLKVLPSPSLHFWRIIWVCMIIHRTVIFGLEPISECEYFACPYKYSSDFKLWFEFSFCRDILRISEGRRVSVAGEKDESWGTLEWVCDFLFFQPLKINPFLPMLPSRSFSLPSSTLMS